MPWGDKQIDSPDLVVVGLFTLVEVSLALVALHVAAKRSVPAYAARVPGLILCAALIGMLLNLAVALRYGWWGTLEGDPEPIIGCDTESFLLWSGAGGLVACAFLRVYRSHRVLIRHNAGMWPVLLQLTVLMMPFLIPLALFAVRTSPMVFDDHTQECERRSEEPEAFALAGLVILAVLTTALTCRLRAVCLQAPEEFTIAVATSVTILSAVLVLPTLHKNLEGERDERRRAMLVASLLTSLAIVAPPLWGPLKGFVLADDAKMEAGGEVGFNKTHKPGDSMRISQDRMKVNLLASSMQERNLPESSSMAWFFRDSLDRESILDPILLQAATMRILNRYILEGAPMFIPLSPSCREEILSSKASSALIFGRARQEVMTRLGGGEVTYCTSPEVGGNLELSKAFGLQPTRKHGSGFTDGPLRKNNVGLFVGSSCVGDINISSRSIGGNNNNIIGSENGGGGSGTGGGDDRESLRVNPFEDGQQHIIMQEGKKKNCATVVGSSCVGGKNNNLSGGENSHGGTGSGDGEDRRVNPFEYSQQQRMMQEGCVARPVEDTVQRSFLDTLDRLMGLRGTAENNFSHSITSSASLTSSAVIDLSKKRKGENHSSSTQKSKKNNEIYISESSDEGGDGHDRREEDEEVEIVFNPLFLGNLTKPSVPPSKKKPR